MVLEPACGCYFDRINCRRSVFDNSRNPIITVEKLLCRENFWWEKGNGKILKSRMAGYR